MTSEGISDQSLDSEIKTQCVDPLVAPGFKPAAEPASAPDEPLFSRLLKRRFRLGFTLVSDRSNIEKVMKDEGVTDPIDQALYTGGVDLMPLLDSGALYRAIAQELVLWNVRNAESARKRLRHFELLPERERALFIEGVVLDLLHVLGGKITFENLDSLSSLARELGMEVDALGDLLMHWKSLRATYFEEAKIALLEKLSNASTSLISGTLQAHRKQVGFIWWRKRPALRPLLTVEHFSNISKVNVMMQEFFLHNHVEELSLEQLDQVRSLGTYSELNSELRARIEKRRAPLAERAEREKAVARAKAEAEARAAKVRAEHAARVKEARSEVNKLIAKLAEIDSELSRVEPVDPENLVNPSLTVSKVNSTARYTDHSALHYAFVAILKADTPHLSSEGFTEVALAVLAQTSRYNNSDWHRATLREVLNLMPIKRMHESDIVKVLTAVVVASRNNNNHSYLHQIFDYIVGVAKSAGLSSGHEDHLKRRFNINGFLCGRKDTNKSASLPHGKQFYLKNEACETGV